MSARNVTLFHDWATTFKRVFTLDDDAIDVEAFAESEFAIRKNWAGPATADNADALVLVKLTDGVVLGPSTIEVTIDAADLKALDPRRSYVFTLQSTTAFGEKYAHSKGAWVNVPGTVV